MIEMKIKENIKTYIEDILDTYFDNIIRNQLMTYFRIFYIFTTTLKYICKIKTMDKENIKELFFEIFDKVINKKMDVNIVKNNFKYHFDFFYKTFFIDNNIYFDTYFNNLPIHFLPVPYEYILYAPLITYRINVDDLYRKNDDDNIIFEKPFEFETISVKSNFHTRKQFVPENELQVHVNMNLFNIDDYNNYNIDDLILYVSDNVYAYICKKNNTSDTLDIIYKRELNKVNIEHYKLQIPYELIFPVWTKCEEKISIKNLKYISIHKKFGKEDLFNIFGSMNFTTDYIKYLFHNTTNKTLDLTKPTFFYMTPFINMKQTSKYINDRKCMIVELKNNIDNILNLTESIVLSNPLTNKIKRDLFESKQLISYDNINILDYYKNVKKENIKKKNHINNACVTSKYNDINDLVKERPFCDIGFTTVYSGRRKLHEIIFKTRKYDTGAIYLYKYHEDTYLKNGYSMEKNKLYYSQRYSFDMVYDTFVVDILKELNINGFFFTDYHTAFDKGGEIVIIEPNKYCEMYYEETKNITCDKLRYLDKKNYK